MTSMLWRIVASDLKGLLGCPRQQMQVLDMHEA